MIALIVYDGPRQDSLLLSRALFKTWLKFYKRSGTTMPFRFFTDCASGLKEFDGYPVTMIEEVAPLRPESFAYIDWLVSRVYDLVNEPCVVMSLETVIIQNIDSIFDDMPEKMAMAAYLTPTDSAGYSRYLARRGIRLHTREAAFRDLVKKLNIQDQATQKSLRTVVNLDDPWHALEFDTSVIVLKSSIREVFDKWFEKLFVIYEEDNVPDRISLNINSEPSRRIWTETNHEIGCELPLDYNMAVYPIETSRPDISISANPCPLTKAKIVTLHGTIRQANVSSRGLPIGIKWYYQQIYDQIENLFM